MGGMEYKKQRPGKGREEQERMQRPGQDSRSRQEGKSPEELRLRDEEASGTRREHKEEEDRRDNES
ncbi:hypothetical protein ACIGFK_04070 [Streptomyces sp. NPDC085524]|uniref:hypothetical protein n=1 Tax=unclassified Streptomyces TaxID=2593676 RepID=UPI0036985343